MPPKKRRQQNNKENTTDHRKFNPISIQSIIVILFNRIIFRIIFFY
jgi:hypothetical protein